MFRVGNPVLTNIGEDNTWLTTVWVMFKAVVDVGVSVKVEDGSR